jgi:hypothetical protein
MHVLTSIRAVVYLVWLEGWLCIWHMFEWGFHVSKLSAGDALQLDQYLVAACQASCAD